MVEDIIPGLPMVIGAVVEQCQKVFIQGAKALRIEVSDVRSGDYDMANPVTVLDRLKPEIV